MQDHARLFFNGFWREFHIFFSKCNYLVHVFVVTPYWHFYPNSLYNLSKLNKIQNFKIRIWWKLCFKIIYKIIFQFLTILNISNPYVHKKMSVTSLTHIYIYITHTVGAIIIWSLADFVGLPTYKRMELCIILIMGTFTKKSRMTT